MRYIGCVKLLVIIKVLKQSVGLTSKEI